MSSAALRARSCDLVAADVTVEPDDAHGVGRNEQDHAAHE